MRNEYKDLGNNVLEIVRADRGEYDTVLDKENGGWYVETIIDGVTKRSKTYPTSQEADAAIKQGTVKFLERVMPQ